MLLQRAFCFYRSLTDVVQIAVDGISLLFKPVTEIKVPILLDDYFHAGIEVNHVLQLEQDLANVSIDG